MFLHFMNIGAESTSSCMTCMWDLMVMSLRWVWRINKYHWAAWVRSFCFMFVTPRPCDSEDTNLVHHRTTLLEVLSSVKRGNYIWRATSTRILVHLLMTEHPQKSRHSSHGEWTCRIVTNWEDWGLCKNSPNHSDLFHFVNGWWQNCSDKPHLEKTDSALFFFFFKTQGPLSPVEVPGLPISMGI